MSFLLNTVFDHILVSYSSTSVSQVGWVALKWHWPLSVISQCINGQSLTVSGHSRHKRVNELSSSKQRVYSGKMLR